MSDPGAGRSGDTGGTGDADRTGDTRPRLLVLRALGLGDLLTGLPALRALREAFGGHELVLAAPAALAPLVTDVAHRLLDVDFRHAVGALRWDGPPPDVAVNLHGRGPQSTRLLRALRPARLIAFDQHGGAAGAPAWRADEHEVTRWCRLLVEEGIACDPRRLGLDVAPDPAARGATILHPGAANAARRWPVDRWAALASALASEGERLLVTGAPEEAGLARRVAAAAHLPDEAVRAGSTDVAGLAALVAGARRVVCGDTGVAHLATATATPSVVLFGPVPPSRWGPPPRSRHRALWAGRTGDPHADRPDAGLLALSVPEVLGAVQGLPVVGRP